MAELTLTGLTGSNTLGFLAALGTLRTLTLAWPSANTQMKWQKDRARWHPVVRADHDLRDVDGVLTALHTELQKMKNHPALARDDTHNTPVADYRVFAKNAAEEFLCSDDRRWADFAAAFGNEAIVDDKGIVEDTALRTMSGQGHQHFVKQMRGLVEAVAPQHLREALLGPWTYTDEQLNMRWDPADDRRHALRWKDPAKDKIKTVWGANRLAIEGLPLLPVFPIKRQLETTGFSGRHRDDTFWTWPIWEGFASVEVVRSLLALPALQKDRPERSVLSSLGVVEVFRSQRIMAGKYRAFTPAQPV